MRSIGVFALACAAAGEGLPRKCRDHFMEMEQNESMIPPITPVPTIKWTNGTMMAKPTLRRSGGCGKSLPVTPGVLTNRQISLSDPGFSGTTSRRYRIFYPGDYKSRDSHPILFRFHGFCGSETSQNNYHQIGAQYGAITVYMRGMNDGSCNSWNNNNAGTSGDASCTNSARAECFTSCNRLNKCSKCNCYTCADDAMFVKAVLDEIAAESCIDLGRVYTSGYSNGGGAAFNLPEALPDLFAATVAVKGLPFSGVFRPPGGLRDTALMSITGTSDRIIPTDGSPSTCGFVYESQQAATRAWADIHDCGSRDTSFSTPYSVSCRTYTGCRNGGSGSVVYCSISGSHSYPSAGYELTWWYLLQHSR